MGFFIHDDPEYNESVRMVGFNRYKQLLSFHGKRWIIVNLITTIAAVPFALGATYSILSSSSLLMLLSGSLGGMILAPFYAAMISSIMKGLMDAPGMFRDNYKKALKQNLLSSLLPGAILGALVSMFIFMAYMLWISSVAPTPGTIALYVFCALLLLGINTLLWPQLVLFEQSFPIRLRNILLFTSKYLWKVLRASILQLAWIILLVIFAPYTLIIIPFLGFWYIHFLSLFIIYDDLNRELHIEDLYGI